MEERRSPSVADAEPLRGRARLVSPWALAGLTAGVLLTLYLLYPRQPLLEGLFASSGGDALNADYIAAMLRNEPGNLELRLLLAEKRHALGQPALAREVLEPVRLSQDALLRRRMNLLELAILESEAKTATGAALEAARASQREQLTRFAEEEWAPAQLTEFARRARALDMPALTIRFDQALERSILAASPRWLAESGDAALGSGDYRRAARLYFLARERAGSTDEQREYFLKALSILRSGNLLKEALTQADARIGNLQNDEQTLAWLARLALAAGDPQRAQVYVKRMLRLSQAAPAPGRSEGPLAAFIGTTLDRLIPSAQAAEAAGGAGTRAATSPGNSSANNAANSAGTASPKAAGNTGMRPYDEPLYGLAFEVFLANGNVGDARRVAEAAVKQRPDDMAWRRRLAQTSEWDSKPQDALVQWLALARRSHTDEAWQAVLRLAPGLQEEEPLLEAWLREASRRELHLEEWKRLLELYESLGKPAEGIVFLKAQFERHGGRNFALLDLVATLEERSGRVDEAIATLERIRVAEPANTARGVRLASLYFLRSDFSRAYALLRPLQQYATGKDAEYWQILAELAWQLQDDATATTAYSRLQNNGSADAGELERLIQLLRPQQPVEARRLALFSWRKFRSVSGFITALELASADKDIVTMKSLLEELSPEDDQRLAANTFYLTLRATYYQAIGNRPAALAELRRAMATDAGNADLRLSTFWLLIDMRETRELRERLRAWSGQSAPAWLDAYAAAWQALGEPQRALPLLARQANRHANDYLWLANYAETLEEAGQPGMAMRMRRHAWLQARAQLRDQPALARPREAMLAHARLALRMAPGDGSLMAMRRLLRQDRGGAPVPDAAAAADAAVANVANVAATNDGAAADAGRQAGQALDSAVSELVLAWTLGEEHLEAARLWLWKRFASRVQAPAWADISLALAERDKDRLAAILEERERSYPAAARIDAARELGRTALARDLAWAEQHKRPDDGDIHLRLASDLLASANSVIARDVLFTRGIVAGHEQSLRLQVEIMPMLRLATGISFLHQHSRDGNQLTGVPGVDRTASLSLLWRHQQGESEITVATRNGLAQFNSLRLTHARPLDDRLSGQAGLSLRERATESVIMGIGARKDEANLTLGYRLSGRETLSARLWSARFQTQQDAALGRGRGLSAEIGHRFRTQYPDFNIRLSRTVSHFESEPGFVTDATAGLLPGSPASAPAAVFMPQSFRLWGLNAGFGNDLREQRSRALRPFADFGRTVSSSAGSGYNWLIGAGGSVIGPDHLSLHWMRSKGGGIGAAVREVALRYQLFFE